MSKFKKYRRTNIAEMKIATQDNIDFSKISISESDMDEVYDVRDGRIEVAGMIARNPNNHEDQWYVSKKYFEENFEILE